MITLALRAIDNGSNFIDIRLPIITKHAFIYLNI